VRCEPDGDSADTIVYACTVFASKTQTADELGMGCQATDVKLETRSSPALSLTPTDTAKAGADFGLSLAKTSIPELGAVSLNASCSPGSGVRVTRPYRLIPKR
jgi:hypothetical protein